MPKISRRRARAASESKEDMPPEREMRKTKKVNYAVDVDVDAFEDEVRTPQPPRLSRLLGTNKVKKQDVQKVEGNAATSGLLKLPPELRERIYKLVLGGNVIHIYSEMADQQTATEPDDDTWYSPDERFVVPDEANIEFEKPTTNRNQRKALVQQPAQKLCISHSICCCTQTDAEFIMSVKAEADEVRGDGDEHESWDIRHEDCHFTESSHSETQRLSLGLLGVCRQIHAEAALLPFQENVFSFQDFNELSNFMQLLNPSQVRAVQHLNIPMLDYSDIPSIETKLKSSFRGLKSLTIILESGDDWEDEEERVGRFAELLQFKKLELGSVTVQGIVTDDDMVRFGRVTLKQFEGWAKDVKDNLKLNWATKDKTELEEMRKEARKKFGFCDKWT